MSKKVKLADVLWEAANNRLSPTYQWSHRKKVDNYSCNAVTFACERMNVHEGKAMGLLRELGCPTYSSTEFIQFTHGPERQGVRFMWLLLAMHVAEDEGIEIEVEA